MEDGSKTRSRKALEDLLFVATSTLRVLQSSKSGHDFIQIHGIPSQPGLNQANYFGSKRRLTLITATSHAMTSRLLPGLHAQAPYRPTEVQSTVRSLATLRASAGNLLQGRPGVVAPTHAEISRKC